MGFDNEVIKVEILNKVDKIKIYSIPGVHEVIDFREGGHKKMKCLSCHRRPCICKNKERHVYLKTSVRTEFIGDNLKEDNPFKRDYILEYR